MSCFSDKTDTFPIIKRVIGELVGRIELLYA